MASDSAGGGFGKMWPTGADDPGRVATHLGTSSPPSNTGKICLLWSCPKAGVMRV